HIKNAAYHYVVGAVTNHFVHLAEKYRLSLPQVGHPIRPCSPVTSAKPVLVALHASTDVRDVSLLRPQDINCEVTAQCGKMSIHNHLLVHTHQQRGRVVRHRGHGGYSHGETIPAFSASGQYGHTRRQAPHTHFHRCTQLMFLHTAPGTIWK